MNSTIAPGAHIELRDAVWRVQRVDLTSTGTQAWRCVGISEIVRDQEAIFLEEYEPKVRVLDPRETTLVRDTSSQHRAGLLYIESLLRDVPPPDDGHAGAGSSRAMESRASTKYRFHHWEAVRAAQGPLRLPQAAG